MRKFFVRLPLEDEAVSPARNAIWGMFRSVEKRFPEHSSLFHSELIRELLIDIQAEDAYMAQSQVQPEFPFICQMDQ